MVFLKDRFWKGNNDFAVRLEHSNVATKAQHTPKELGPPLLSFRDPQSFSRLLVTISALQGSGSPRERGLG